MQAGPEPVTDPNLWWVLRASVSSLTDDLGRFVGANVVWLTVALLPLTLARLHPAANLLALALVPATAGLGRMAVVTVRGQAVRARHFRRGATVRWRFALVLGALQLGIGTVSWLNVGIGVTAMSLPLVVAAVASAWLLLLVAASAVTVWPLLLDPARDELSLRRLLRLAMAVVVTRPGRTILVIAVEVVVVQGAAQFLIATLLLPSVGVLFATHAVIPVADRLEGRRRRGAGDG